MAIIQDKKSVSVYGYLFMVQWPRPNKFIKYYRFTSKAKKSKTTLNPISSGNLLTCERLLYSMNC